MIPVIFSMLLGVYIGIKVGEYKVRLKMSADINFTRAVVEEMFGGVE